MANKKSNRRRKKIGGDGDENTESEDTSADTWQLLVDSTKDRTNKTNYLFLLTKCNGMCKIGMGKETIRKVRGLKVLNDDNKNDDNAVVVRVNDDDIYFTNGYNRDQKESLLKKENCVGSKKELAPGKFMLEPIDPAITQGGKTRRHKKKYRKSRKSRKNRKF
jgi:hypothetical protein